MIDALVRPFTTWAFVAAIIYMAVVQVDETARAAAVNLGIAVVSFWFGQRTSDKAIAALTTGTGTGTGTAVAVTPARDPAPAPQE